MMTRVGFEPTPFRTAILRNPEHSALDRSAILPYYLILTAPVRGLMRHALAAAES